MKIKKGDYVFHHAVAERDEEKSYPRINITMTKVKKVKDSLFEDENGNIFEKRRVSRIWRKGQKNLIKNDLYDEKQNFKEDLKALINE